MTRVQEEEDVVTVVVVVVVVADLKETTLNNLQFMIQHLNHLLKRVRYPKDLKALSSEEDVEEDNLNAILAPEDHLLENTNVQVEAVATGENLVLREKRLL